MKLRSTTPASLSFSKRASIVVAAIAIAVTTPLAITQQAGADRFDTQIAALQQEVNQYQAAAQALSRKADTLQRKLDKINNDIARIKAKIKINKLKYDKLVAQIEETKKKIQENRDALGDVIADLSIGSKVSPLAMLASSKNISDYVDKQAYRESIQDELNATIKRINELKDALETQKKEVETVLAKLDAQKTSLAGAQAEQAQLVARTRGQESAYRSLQAASQRKLESIAAQQRAYYQSLINSGGGGAGVVGAFSYSNWSGNLGCSGGYPYCAPQDTQVDPWNLYNRECVSYVAWALENRFGKEVNPFRGDGNAMDWPYSAPRWSGAYRVSRPAPGDVVVLPASGSFAPIGHVMIVESVSGNTMFVSQYNFYGSGEYSTMNVQNSGVILLRFLNK